MRKLAPLVIVVVLALASVASGNLLVNGDFAQNGVSAQLGTAVISNWSSWGTSGWYNNDIGGNMSVKMWWDDTGLYQNYNCTAGQAYQYSVSAQQVSGDPLVAWQGYLKAEFYDAGSGQLLAQELDYFVASDPTNQWVTLSGIVTSPVGSVQGRIVLGVNNWGAGAGGAAYFDDASVLAIPEPTLAALFGFAGLIFLAGRKIARRK